MDVVRRIFHLVGAGGKTLGSLARVMERQGVLTPEEPSVGIARSSESAYSPTSTSRTPSKN